MLSNALKRRPLVILAGVVIFVAIFLSVLPLITRYFLLRSVDQSLAVSSQLENLDINLFTGKISAEGIKVTGHATSSLSGATLYIDIAMLQLLRGNIEIESVTANGLFLRIEEADDGSLILVIPLPDEPGTADSEALTLPLFTLRHLQVTDSRIELDALDLQAQAVIEELTLSGFSTASTAPSQLTLLMRWNDAAIALDGTITPFAEVPGLALALQVKGLNLADFSSQLPETVAGLQGQLQLDARVEGDLQAIQGELDLLVNDLGAINGHFAAAIPVLGWQGTFAVTDPAGTPAVTARGDLNLDQLEVDDTRQGARLLQWDSLQLTGFKLGANNSVSIATTEFSGLKTIVGDDGKTSPAAAGKLTIESLSLADNRLVIDAISGADMSSSILVTADGELHAQGMITGALESFEEGSSEPAPETSAPSTATAPETANTTTGAGQTQADAAAFSWQIKNSAFSDSRVYFRDLQFSPPLELELQLDQMTLGNLDSAAVGSATPLQLAGRIGEYGKLNVDGEITPLADQLALQLEGKIESLRLPLVSPYIEHLLGYELTAGQYDHEFSAAIADEELTSTNKMVLRKLKVKSAPDVEATAPLPMPLGLALDMLRDGNDNIKLEVPVSGRMDDPDIGVDQVISTALGKALMAGSTTYLKLALQPYGAIWMGAELGLKAVGKMSLDPMVFSPLAAEPNSENLAYAEKLSVLMTERPNLELQLCGVSGTADHQALLAQLTEQTNADAKVPATEPAALQLNAQQEAQLLQLARTRQQALKQLLVQQYSIEAKRLYTCKASASAQQKLSGVSLAL